MSDSKAVIERVALAICVARAKVNDCTPEPCSAICPWCMASALAAIDALVETPEAAEVSA